MGKLPDLKLNDYHWLQRLQSVHRLSRAILLLPLLFFSPLKCRGDQVESLKKVLSTPPCVDLVRFSVRRDCNPGSEETFLLAACGEDFVFRRPTKEIDFLTPISRTNRNRSSLFLGRVGTTRWQIAGYNVTRSFEPNLSAPDPYVAAADSTLMMLAEPLTLGNNQLQPGSFEWSGDHFTAQLNPLAKQFMTQTGRDEVFLKKFLEGELRRVSPTNFALEAVLWSAELQFDPVQTLPDGWPRKVKLKSGGKCTREIIYHSVVLGTPETVRRIADPSNLITEEVAQNSMWSNSVQITKAPSKDLVVSLVRNELGENQKGSAMRRNAKVMGFGAVGALCLGALGWLALRKG